MHSTHNALLNRLALAFAFVTISAVTILVVILSEMPDTKPVTSQAVAPVATTQSVSDLANEDTSDQDCWFEKAESLDTAELICGDRGLRPAGSVDWYEMHRNEVPSVVWQYAVEHGAVPGDHGVLEVPVGTVFGPSGHGWVATVEGMEPA